MTVKELIEALQKMPPDAPVCVEADYLSGRVRGVTVVKEAQDVVMYPGSLYVNVSD